MNRAEGYERITLSISGASNDLLEELQYELRKLGRRHYKAEIIHEAIEYLANALRLECVPEAGAEVEGQESDDVEDATSEDGEVGLGA